MEEEFFFESNEDAQRSVERYEEMIRNQDQYFFDAGAFEYIVDFYIEKNDPVADSLFFLFQMCASSW